MSFGLNTSTPTGYNSPICTSEISSSANVSGSDLTASSNQPSVNEGGNSEYCKHCGQQLGSREAKLVKSPRVQFSFEGFPSESEKITSNSVPKGDVAWEAEKYSYEVIPSDAISNIAMASQNESYQYDFDFDLEFSLDSVPDSYCHSDNELSDDSNIEQGFVCKFAATKTSEFLESFYSSGSGGIIATINLSNMETVKDFILYELKTIIRESTFKLNINLHDEGNFDDQGQNVAVEQSIGEKLSDLHWIKSYYLQDEVLHACTRLNESMLLDLLKERISKVTGLGLGDIDLHNQKIEFLVGR